MKEMFVEYMPTRTEEMISDFYVGDYDRLILDSDIYVYTDEDGNISELHLLRYYRKKVTTYKIYLIIEKAYDCDNDRCRSNLIGAYPILGNDRIMSKLTNITMIDLYRDIHKLTLTDIKTMNNASILQFIIGRTIYNSSNRINGNVDLYFKCPYPINARTIGKNNLPWYYEDGIAISGIRLEKKDFIPALYTNSVIERDYYFPEEYPDLYTIVEE